MIKHFELTVLATAEQKDEAVATVNRLTRKHGGKTTSFEEGGNKRLAYPINGHERADYLYWEVDLDHSATAPLSHDLSLEDSVLRYLLVQSAKKPTPTTPTAPTTRFVYKVVSEWSAPTYYDYDTNEELEDTTDASEQALWVVKYDTEDKVIDEWVEQYYTHEAEEAKARAEELNEEGE